MKNLGVHFGQELINVGLNDGIGWTSDGQVFGLESKSPEDRAIIEALIDAHDPTPIEFVPRTTAMWRARAVMKMTPYADGATLFDAVTQAIAGLGDNLRPIVEEVLSHGEVFDLDGELVPVLAFALGVDEVAMLELIKQANTLPA